MRRVLEEGELIHNEQVHRLLVVEADTAQELQELLEKARDKGWLDYAEGQVPDRYWHGAWMLKPVDAPVASLESMSDAGNAPGTLPPLSSDSLR